MTEVLTWRVRATVERIVDGDTFVATMDLGWGVIRKEVPGAISRVRPLHYDAPERIEADFAEGVLALATVLPIGTVVWVTSHKLDSFGRALCDVEMLDGQNLLDLLPSKWRVV